MNSRFSQIENIDDKDMLILEAIENDARLTYQEIGERVGLSRVAVKNRMDAMKEKGIIKGFVTEINGMAAPEGILFFLALQKSL